MLSNRVASIALSFLLLFCHGLARAEQSQNPQHLSGHVQRNDSPRFFDEVLHWALSNAVSLLAGSTVGGITTAIVAFKFRAHGLPLENARLVGQMVSAVQHGQGLSLEPIAHLVNTFRAAHESGIRLNPDGTFAVDWWRLDEATKKLFVATLKRLSGEER